jgi:hypothetical protein
MNLDFQVTEKKTFRQLCDDVIKRSESKREQLDILMESTRNLIKTTNDAIALLPQVKALLDVGVKNDEQIIKLASVLQKLQSTEMETNDGDDGILSSEEREEIMRNAKEEIKVIDKNVDSLEVKNSKPVSGSI